ncbi:MAG: aminotransferase class IV [Patescibacteria group bacterium]
MLGEPHVCYQNGEYISADRVCISPWDLGYLRGYGVFDVMPVINNKALLWEWHYDRLLRSASELGLTLHIGKEEYGEVLKQLIVKNEGKNIIFRTVLSGGISEDAFTPVVNKETFLILTEEFHPLPEEIFKKGARVMTQDHVRFFPQVKMTHYVSAIRTLGERQSKGALETLYIQDGVVSECAQSNFFIIKNGVVVTTNENALLGITQKLIVEKLAPENALLVEVRKITFEEVLNADEAFLTGSNKGVVPVVQIDEAIIGEGIPGPVTQRLVQLYQEFLQVA